MLCIGSTYAANPVDSYEDSQPINLPIMREAEYELVYHSIDANCAAHELERGIVGVVEDEMMAVEVG